MGVDLVERNPSYEICADLVDGYTRMGYNPLRIAQDLLGDPKLAILFEDITEREDIDNADKTTRILKRIRGIQKQLASRRKIAITQDSVADALVEYLGREDQIYFKAWLVHSDAPDFETKLKALQVAQEAAKNKAIALGVPIGKQMIERTRRARIPIDTPDGLLDLVNQVHEQLQAPRQRVLELEETTTFEGVGIVGNGANSSDMA